VVGWGTLTKDRARHAKLSQGGRFVLASGLTDKTSPEKTSPKKKKLGCDSAPSTTRKDTNLADEVRERGI